MEIFSVGTAVVEVLQVPQFVLFTLWSRASQTSRLVWLRV